MKTIEKTNGKISLLLLMTCFMLLTSSTTPITKNVSERIPNSGFVTLCHYGRNIKASPESVEYHLRHGDHMGACLADPH